MPDKAILEKAIQKAIDGGWKHRNGWTYLANYRKKAPLNSVQFADETGEVWHMPVETLIFNHDFAKALWGEEYPSKVESAVNRGFKFWQSRLMMMVIADDPIKYLGQNL